MSPFRGEAAGIRKEISALAVNGNFGMGSGLRLGIGLSIMRIRLCKPDATSIV